MTQTMPNYAIISLPLPPSQMVRIDDLLAAVAAMIAAESPDGQVDMLGLLVAALERAGVHVPEMWRCALDEMAAD